MDTKDKYRLNHLVIDALVVLQLGWVAHQVLEVVVLEVVVLEVAVVFFFYSTYCLFSPRLDTQAGWKFGRQAGW